MIVRPDLKALAPAERAAFIYASAKSEMTSRLWRAALGSGDRDGEGQAGASTLASAGGFDLDSLIDALSAGLPEAAGRARGPQQLLPENFAAPVPQPVAGPVPDRAPGRADSGTADADGRRSAAAPSGLGPNARHAAAIDSAAARTGLPAPALAAIIDAEAAKKRDGSWNTHSRNPRSSAAGLGQFLAGTWEGEAERPGTWLNRAAHERGWLDEGGRVVAAARSDLLALRYDARAAIEATADYARRNLDRLQAAGVRIGDGMAEIARAAYLGHHLGAGDAVRFLSMGGLPAARAEKLLVAQIGGGAAAARIAEAGQATAAHRDWLLGFVDRHIDPARFAG
ncbi:peptidoglycan-binding protein [Sphingomonas changnyeongensis]|uniref:Peptidoglycan-binding protein n=1 Tax=Sphingomonas changnyeongensis TaxID=2698679 RepID=A0A7Z2NUD1_9SPHN|nr:peptidoglycan-binding protein [Sphingomonas changnyeongensis]QHL89732.1 peptidoglycan-binding protein [Sphingomonas changnyeongensis]